MAGIRTCDRKSQVQRNNHYTVIANYLVCYLCSLYLHQSLYYDVLRVNMKNMSIKIWTLVTLECLQ